MPEKLAPVKTAQYPGPVTVVIVWTALAALSYTRFYLQVSGTGMAPRIWPDCLHWLTCFYAWIPFTPVIFHLERRFPLERVVWRRNLPLLVLAGVVICWMASVVGGAAALLVRWFFPHVDWKPSSIWSVGVGGMAVQFVIFASVVGAGYLIRKAIHLQQQEALSARLALEKSQLETSLRVAELEALRMRLNPHFLFNTLQNISVLVRQDPPLASQMLARLGDLLRVALKRDRRHEISLEEEIGITECYLAVEKMRFYDRLSVRFDLEPGTEHALVPSLLLQPLVENAITHGLSGRSGGDIVIRARRENGQLALTITDDGAGPPEDEIEMGTGLGSTSERLARLYPNQHELSMRKSDAGGTEVRVLLPFRTGAPAESPRDELVTHVG